VPWISPSSSSSSNTTTLRQTACRDIGKRQGESRQRGHLHRHKLRQLFKQEPLYVRSHAWTQGMQHAAHIFGVFPASIPPQHVRDGQQPDECSVATFPASDCLSWSTNISAAPQVRHEHIHAPLDTVTCQASRRRELLALCKSSLVFATRHATNWCTGTTHSLLSVADMWAFHRHCQGREDLLKLIAGARVRTGKHAMRMAGNRFGSWWGAAVIPPKAWRTCARNCGQYGLYCMAAPFHFFYPHSLWIPTNTLHLFQ